MFVLMPMVFYFKQLFLSFSKACTMRTQLDERLFVPHRVLKVKKPSSENGYGLVIKCRAYKLHSSASGHSNFPNQALEITP